MLLSFFFNYVVVNNHGETILLSPAHHTVAVAVTAAVDVVLILLVVLVVITITIGMSSPSI